MRKDITIGSRGSKLALIQAEWVLNRLREAHPQYEFNLVKIKTRGDRYNTTPLGKIGGKGAFVKELEWALLENRIDLAVHSLKDMTTVIPQGLSLAAVTERLDSRDVLVSTLGRLSGLPFGARIGTGSLRRRAQLLDYRPDLKVQEIRGNVDTRIRKALSGQVDGVILSAAAMFRLGWEEKATEYLPLEHFLPPAGQGALGVEIRMEDKEIAQLVSCLNHYPTWCSVVAEQAFLRALGGGCHLPAGVLGSVEGEVLELRGMVANADGRILRASEKGSISAPEDLGNWLAQKMLKMKAAKWNSGRHCL